MFMFGTSNPFGKPLMASIVTCLHAIVITDYLYKIKISTEIQAQYDLSICDVSNVKQTLFDHIGMGTCHGYPAHNADRLLAIPYYFNIIAGF